MAEENLSTKTAVVDPAKNNADIAQQLADQDASGHTTVGTAEDLANTAGALDKLAAQHPDPALEKDDAPVVEPAKADPAVVAAPDKDAEAKAAADKLAADAKAEESRKAEEFFKDAPKLPPGASHKSSEAFSGIKVKAAQEISAREQQIEALKKEKADLEEKLKAGPTPEALKELEDHRQWRAKLDVESDPKFKEFDKVVSANHEFIYAQLKKSPVINQDVIDQIKKHGGPDMVNMDKIFEAVKDPSLQRLVESKLADIEMAKFNKENAIKDAKANITKYVEDQQANAAKSATAHNDATKAKFGEFSSKLTWMKEAAAEAGATEDKKKSIEAHNEFVKTTKAQLEAALNDDSPDMRAILLTGMAQLLQLQRVHAAQAAELEAAKKGLAEATEKLGKYTKASVSRLRESSAPPSGSKPPVKEADVFHKRAAESLDDIAKQVMQERAAKAT